MSPSCVNALLSRLCVVLCCACAVCVTPSSLITSYTKYNLYAHIICGLYYLVEEEFTDKKKIQILHTFCRMTVIIQIFSKSQSNFFEKLYYYHSIWYTYRYFELI